MLVISAARLLEAVTDADGDALILANLPATTAVGGSIVHSGEHISITWDGAAADKVR